MRDTHPRVKITTSFDPHLCNIKGSDVHLQKIFMNLINNALDAIEDEGSLSISIDNYYIDKPTGAYEQIPEGEFVCYCFKDSGTGIPRDELSRVFEPFFTKKVLGRSGTGLGMVIVWNTVKDHGGYVDIESEPGSGTTVSLYFPITRDDVSEDNKILQLESYEGNNEKILVVDDVELQRQVATSILERLHYRVDAVSSGLEAIDYLKHHSVEVIILDMIMDPGINGLETCKQIFSFLPDARIIMVSGYSEEELINEALSLGAKTVLKKPYTIDALGKIVHDTLSNDQNEKS